MAIGAWGRADHFKSFFCARSCRSSRANFPPSVTTSMDVFYTCFQDFKRWTALVLSVLVPHFGSQFPVEEKHPISFLYPALCSLFSFFLLGAAVCVRWVCPVYVHSTGLSAVGRCDEAARLEFANPEPVDSAKGTVTHLLFQPLKHCRRTSAPRLKLVCSGLCSEYLPGFHL